MSSHEDEERRTGRQRFATAAKWLFTLATVGFLVLFLMHNAGELPQLFATWRERGDRGWTVLALMGCYLASWTIVAAQLQMPLRRLSPEIGFLENAALVIGGALLNYSPFKAGVLYRFHYLKTWHRVSYTTLAGVQLVRILATVGVAGLVGLCALGIHCFRTGLYDPLLLLVNSLMLLLGAAPLLLPLERIRRYSGPLARYVHNLARGVEELRESPRMGLLLLLLIGCQFLVLLVQYRIIFMLVGLEPGLLSYLILIPLITILGMVSITPGNLGLREILTASALAVSAGSFDAGMIVGLVDRGGLLVASMLFGCASLAYLTFHRRQRSD